MRMTLKDLARAKVALSLTELTDLAWLKRSHHTAENLRDLISESPSNSKKRKGNCSARFVGFNKGDTAWHLTYRVVCSENYSDSKGHIVKFRLYPEVGISDALDLEVEVSCSCKAFLYWGAQWNLNTKNSLERVQPGSQLSAPTKKEHNFVVCKHVAKAADVIQLLLAKHIQQNELEQL